MYTNNLQENMHKDNGNFKINPEALHMIGQQIIDESNAFGQNVKKIYENIEELTNKSYLSNEAIVIANKIKSNQQNLINLTRIIENYGIHCQKSAKIMIEAQNSIVEGIK